MDKVCKRFACVVREIPVSYFTVINVSSADWVSVITKLSLSTTAQTMSFFVI